MKLVTCDKCGIDDRAHTKGFFKEFYYRLNRTGPSDKIEGEGLFRDFDICGFCADKLKTTILEFFESGPKPE